AKAFTTHHSRGPNLNSNAASELASTSATVGAQLPNCFSRVDCRGLWFPSYGRSPKAGVNGGIARSGKMAREERYFVKAHHTINNCAIDIARAIKAARITSKLNLRIRLSYARVQPICRPSLESFPNAADTPLPFICRFYHTENPDTAAKVSLAKDKF